MPFNATEKRDRDDWEGAIRTALAERSQRSLLLAEVDAGAVHQAIARSARSGLRRKPDISAV